LKREDSRPDPASAIADLKQLAFPRSSAAVLLKATSTICFALLARLPNAPRSLKELAIFAGDVLEHPEEFGHPSAADAMLEIADFALKALSESGSLKLTKPKDETHADTGSDTRNESPTGALALPAGEMTFKITRDDLRRAAKVEVQAQGREATFNVRRDHLGRIEGLRGPNGFNLVTTRDGNGNIASVAARRVQ
jgi:hypothetical protein